MGVVEVPEQNIACLVGRVLVIFPPAKMAKRFKLCVLERRLHHLHRPDKRPLKKFSLIKVL